MLQQPLDAYDYWKPRSSKAPPSGPQRGAGWCLEWHLEPYTTHIYMLQRRTPPLPPPAMVMVCTPPPPVDLWWPWVGVIDG